MRNSGDTLTIFRNLSDLHRSRSAALPANQISSRIPHQSHFARQLPPGGSDFDCSETRLRAQPSGEAILTAPKCACGRSPRGKRFCRTSVTTSVIARAAVPPDNAHQHFRNRFPILFARYRSFHCHCEGACARGNPPIRICRGRCPHRPGKPQACAMLRIAGRMKASAPTMSNAPSSHPLSLRGGEADVAISRHSSTNSPKTCVRRIVRRRLPRRSFRPPRNDMLF